MSADYLDLLLGRATGSVPAAEPRIHSAMAPSQAVPVWGEVVEERIVAYPDPTPPQYRGATPSAQPAAQAYMPPVQAQDPSAHRSGPRELQDRIVPGQRATNPTDDSSDPPERHPARASMNLLPAARTDEADPGAPHRSQTMPQPPSPRAITQAEGTQPEPMLQPRHEQARQPLVSPGRPLLPRREFAPALTRSEQKPQPAPEARAAPVSAAAPVTIRIDRIEVHAAPPAKAAAPPSVAKPPVVGLDDYLSRRKGASR